MVNISYGGHLSSNKSMINSPSAFEPDMTFTDYSKAVKDAVSIPVSVVGKIMTPEEAEQYWKKEKRMRLSSDVPVSRILGGQKKL